MATATVQPPLESTLLDEQAGHVLQTYGLLSVLIRNFGGEVDQEERMQDEDVYRTLKVSEQLLESALDRTTLDQQGAWDLRLIQETVSVVRSLTCAAFIQARDSLHGKVQQASNDDILLNSVWAAKTLIEKIRNTLP